MHSEANVINEPQSAEEPLGQRSQDRPSERIKVLLIEDNPADAHLIQLMLAEAAGDLFEVEQVERLQDAIERIAEGDYAIALSDLSLPDSHGLETFEQLHARAPRVPIIVFSGLNDTTIAVQAVHEGAQDYLIKGQVDGQLLVRSMRYAIERKRMTLQLGQYAEELRTKNAQLEADFNMAREIQEIFLPHQYPTFPHWVGPEESTLRFFHRYMPAAVVGGDFFDVFPITDTAGGIFICDVMGHGMRAALVTAIMRGLIEELMPVAADPGKFLSEINRSLHTILRRTRDPFLATAFYGVADVAAGELRFASAGHPSPFLVQRRVPEVEPLKHYDQRHGPALGLFGRPTYPTCRYPIHERDVVMLYTDGLYEVDNADHEEYGQDRLLESVRRQIQAPTDEILDGVVAEVQSYSATAEFDDDVCIVAVEVESVGTQF
jgi:sigma-B regulation protein RsbU (phosphoserine phosphatase)